MSPSERARRLAQTLPSRKSNDTVVAKAPSSLFSFFPLAHSYTFYFFFSLFGSHMSAGHRELRSSLGDEELMEMSSPPPPRADC